MEHRDPPLTHHYWVWDTAIALLILCPPVIASWIITAFSSPIAFVIAVILMFGTILVIYGSFFEPQLLSVNTKIIHISSLPAMTIGVMADFHIGPYRDQAHIERAVRAMNNLQPDIIFLPGDFVFDHTSDITHLSPLKHLHAPLGVYAIMGNHDSGNHSTLGGVHFVTTDRTADITAYLENLGIAVLRDTHVIQTHEGKQFAIAGVDGPWIDLMDLTQTFKNIPMDLPVILLAHNPDVVLNDASHRADLIVSGHTHGGQVRLPFIGPLHVPAKTGRRYAQGIFSIGEKTTLAVTHGIGETLARARLFCPPEILLLKIEN